jgi:hypothetical protein
LRGSEDGGGKRIESSVFHTGNTALFLEVVKA